MEANYGFNPFSDEEIRELAQALRDNRSSSTVSESELRDIINALMETEVSGRSTQQGENREWGENAGNPGVSKDVREKSEYEKSNLVNVFRGLDDDDEVEGAAGPRAVDTSTFPTSYPHDRNPCEIDSSEQFEMISHEEMEEIRTALDRGDLCKATEEIRNSLEDIENAKLNIAITGESGSGKSTFVNAIRGLDNDEEEGAAKTGVTETTMEPQAYKNPLYNNVTIWDLPGIGSTNFKACDYLEAVDFYRYDFFIIMSSERFRQNDMDLAKEIKSMGKRFYFVRSKVDADLHASQMRRKKTYDEERILNEIRDNCIECLHKGGIQDQRVFLLSCLDFKKYDFYQLQETLEKELPSEKRHVFLLSVPSISRPILEKKRKALQKQIWKWATLSCAVATFPVPGLSVACDIGILVKEMKKYRDAFGLDPRSLRKLANRFHKDINELKSVIKSPIVVKDINKELVTMLLTRGAVGSLMIVEFLVSNVPVVGTVAAGGISFGTTYYMLYSFLKDVADDALRVLQKTLDSSV